MEWLTKVIDVLKLPLKYIWVIAIASGFLLFLPQALLQNVNLVKFCQDYNPYIGAVFLFSSILVGVHLVSATWGFIRDRFLQRRFSRMRTQALQRLDPKEKAVLREFFIQEQSTLRMPIDQPVVAGLISKGVLVRVGQLGESSLAGMLFSVALAEDVERRLTHVMIDLPESNPTEEEIQWFRNNRPDFMPEIEHHDEVFHTSWKRRRIDF